MMRRLGLLFVMLAVAGCGGVDGATPSRKPSAVAQTGPSLFCGKDTVTLTHRPAGQASRFSKLELLVTPDKVRVRGLAWGKKTRVGVVCGVNSAEHFATLVRKSRLDMHNGKPALRWTHKTLRYLMWLDKPGTAVFVGAPAAELDQLVSGIKVGNPSGS